ncbi:hypothetical protein CMV_014900 [Castanea mollissima]|uniref:Uncharacterized protein n=1 Tax=Castanea mollissima TaxID=60419 RepID=A0A8J4VKL8_9ROSI|nr:hypothetical protein CMV_014900 [Castanea mollissima]
MPRHSFADQLLFGKAWNIQRQVTRVEQTASSNKRFTSKPVIINQGRDPKRVSHKHYVSPHFSKLRFLTQPAHQFPLPTLLEAINHQPLNLDESTAAFLQKEYKIY